MNIHPTIKKYSILSFFMIVTILVCTLLPYDLAKAATYVDYDSTYATWTVELNNDSIIIHNYDKTRSSSTAYKTLGFTVSRCKPGLPELYNGTATEWIALDIADDGVWGDPEEVITTDNKKYTHTKWSISMQKVYEEVVRLGYIDWANEIKSYYIDKTATDDLIYLKFDSIMCIIRYTNEFPDGIYGGRYDCRNRRVLTGTCYTNTPLESDLPDTLKNPYVLQNAKPWANATPIIYHYNRYLPETNPGDPGGSGGSGITIGTPVSLYETKNYSSIYNISKAIPSGEQVSNAVSASTVNGSVGVTTQTKTKDYSVTYRYYYTEPNVIEYYTYVRPDISYVYVGGGYGYVYVGPAKGDYTSSGVYVGYGNGDHVITYDGNGYWSPNGDGTFRYDPDHGTYNQVENHKGDYSHSLVTQPSGEVKDVYTYVGANKGDYTRTYINDGTYREVEILQKTFNFTASASYQYISSINIEAIESMKVDNTAFPSGSITYDKTSLTNTNVSASLILRSMTAQAAGRTWDTINSGANLDGYNFAPNDSHCIFPDESILVSKSIDMSAGHSTAQVEARINADKEIIRDILGGNVITSNDGFTLNDNGNSIVFMDSTECIGATITDGTNTWHYGTQAADSIYRYAANGQTFNEYVSSLSAARATSSRTVTIPVNTQNGDHPTGLTATYKNLFGNTINDYSAGMNYGYTDSIYNHVMSGGVLSEHNGGDPDDGYPIRVHTPIVAPFEIVFNDLTPAVEQTQLVNTKFNTASEYQLLLDRQYYLKWDNDLWLSNVYGDVGYGNVFDRYVAKKEVRFPFSVVYNGKLYELTASGYTQWIEVQRPYDYTDAWNYGVNTDNYESANHWQMMPFYIPSFAEEGGWTGDNKYVEVAVYAYNFTGTDLDDTNENAVNIVITNGAISDYIATARKQLQLSGWLYDFTVVGTSNISMYIGNGLTSKNLYEKIGNLSLASLKFELKTGTKNRLGTNNIRYLSDGTVNNTWNPLQTIPMRDGQSFAFSNLGKVWKGQTFAYTIKTISNLNGNNDYLRITPTFKYINKAGEILNSENGDFKMYEVTNSSIKEYNPADISISDGNFVVLADELFADSYYDTSDKFSNQQLGDWPTSSVNRENVNNAATGYYSSITTQEFMNRSVLSYNLSSIYISPYLRYMSGEYEQLQMNDGMSYDRNTGTSTLKTYWDTISNYTSAKEIDFQNSMQQWQSCYVVPSNVYIVDTRSIGGGSFDIYSYINSQEQFSWEKCPIAVKDEGQLIVGFEIIAYKNGNPYLEYSGANNMWMTEGSLPRPIPTIPPIPVDEDDVAIIDMEKSITDYYEPGILNIN